MSNSLEQVVVFQSAAESLYGLLHTPEHTDVDTGVVILVGGPQYRVGSHRQFVELARGLALDGIPVFRFDFSGMGDSTGRFPGFENLNGDIRQAIDAFVDNRPEVKRIILWGLCDGASAACFYADQDERVAGLCLANPWVRTEQGEAKAFLKYYYLSRLVSKEFWTKLLSGKLKVLQTVFDLISNVKRSRATRSEVADADYDANASRQQVALPVRVFQNLALFSGKVMFLISGNDLTAAEFMDSVGNDRKRQKLMNSNRINLTRFPDADHTFSRREWMNDVVQQTASWIKLL
jgi:uncharacterized protein